MPSFKKSNRLRLKILYNSILTILSKNLPLQQRNTNVMGNKYRLVVSMVFEYSAIQIKWFGTHAEYDLTSVEKVKFKKK